MTSTSTTESRSSLRDRRSAVPLLLSSFPAPPSHIPSSPFTPLNPSPINPSPNNSAPGNPPPSLPPSSPLPPVPGPSPITEHETLIFISAARSRRASKLSLASSSSYSRRNSTATLASNASGSNNSLPSLSPSASVTPLDSSTRSLRSFPSCGSLSVPASRLQDRSPVIEPRICEEDPADLTRMSLDEISLHSCVPDHDLSGDEKFQLGITPASPLYPPHSANDMLDLPKCSEDEFSVPKSAPIVLNPHHLALPAHGKPSSDQIQQIVNKALPPLPTSSPPLASSPPSSSKRADSPDIQTILAATPRPRRKSASATIAARSRSRSSSRPSHHSTLRRHVSEGVNSTRARSSKISAGSRRTSEASLPKRRSRPGSPSELAYMRNAGGDDDSWNDDSFVSDYGVPLDDTGTPLEIFDQEEEERLERELEGDGSDTDSSLDIHTPLPHLMLRDGLLSPNSKLLPRVSRTPSPQPPMPNARPGSLLSVASTVGSVMTKSGLFKDQRDTDKRRHRHRDGKLLRGGIGLTTGLGWSDSEDEDAPSPLTHKLSSGTLRKKSTASSLRSSHPLSRSFSDADLEPLPNHDSAAIQGANRERSSFPLSSSQRNPVSTYGRRTSSNSHTSAASSTVGIKPRASVSSLRSTASSTRVVTLASAQLLSHIHEREESDTPSSSSSISPPVPVTPLESDDNISVRRMTSGMSGMRKINSEFHSPYALDVTTQSTAGTMGSRVGKSIKPSRSYFAAGMPTPPLPPSSGVAHAAVPRPLRLPQERPRLNQDGTHRSIPSSSSGSSAKSLDRVRTYSGGLQRPPPLSSSTSARPSVVGVTCSDSTAYSPTTSRSGSIASPKLSPASPGGKLKPRTGTGMTYRTSSNPSIRPSMMRKPSSTTLQVSMNAGIGIAI
ncbi:hypothetical protein AcV5_009933 [Taiwanofungus camphoratus]|nr:hypothetical protein AcV5_009933 [Antrodia cinnamomea]